MYILNTHDTYTRTTVHDLLIVHSGWTISAFQDEVSGFAMPMSASRLVEANDAWKRAGNAPLVESPGIRTLEFGKHADGYWTMEKMLAQLKANLHCAQQRYPDFQLLYYFDWSSGHSAMPPGALHAASINAGVGGKQPLMRSTRIAAAEGFLGPHDPKLQVGEVQ